MSIFSNPNAKNRPSRNGFDLSKRNLFTAPCGQLLPIYHKYCLPGDKFRINVSSLTRTLPVNTDAFVRLREYVDFFFVPYRLLYKDFPNWVIQNTDTTSVSARGEAHLNNGLLPYLNFNHILDSTFSYNSDAAKSSHVDDCGLPYVYGAYRLWDMLGYGQFYKCGIEDASGDSDVQPPFFKQNAFALAAYQKIYADFYRNTEWEKDDVASWNLDAFSQVPDPNINSFGEGRAWKMSKIRYANYKKDILMSVVPSAQFGSVAVAPINSGNSFFIHTDQISSSSPASFTSNGNLGTGGSGKSFRLTDSSAKNVGISVLDIRQAQALQRWKEVTLLNGFRYNEQVEAHFGFKVPDSRAQIAEFIDGFTNNIQISQVVNTGEKQGTVTGLGVGVNDSHTIDYTPSEHGVIMAIYHVMPDIDYNQSRAHEDNTMLDYEDFFIPEYERVGYGDVQSFNFSYGLDGARQQQAQNNIIGFQMRYAHMKTDLDEAHGAFADGNPFDDFKRWISPIPASQLNDYLTEAQGIVDYRFFKVHPNCVDGIFATRSTGETGNDKFLCNFYFDVKAVRNMSVDSLPY